MKYGKSNTPIARTLIATAISACFAPLVFALPVAPTVVNGSATFVQNGNLLTVTNSNQAIINWQSFSIGSSETTKFVQPSASSSVLNRVTGSDPSLLLGSMQSNGRVYLINAAGILVGQGARLDVAGFVASSLNLSDSDFLANRLRFTETPGAGKVQNLGEIVTPNGGNVYLVAPQVENSGIISAPNGEVLLAAGQRVELIDTATPGVRVEVVGSVGDATNLGTITAEAGRIGIAGVLVRNSGTLNASSLVSAGGRIFLKASTDTLVDGDSRITATGSSGGRIEVLGNRVAVMDNAQLDASGQTAGGTVLVGGDYQGKSADVQNSQITYFGPQASIKADATDNGDGGKVIVWADDTTRAYGKILARGGKNGGNGGFVETSGKRFLDFHATADLRAPRGKSGMLLLDPNNVEIVSGTTLFNGSYSGGIFSSSSAATPSQIGWNTIITQLGLGNVAITTSGPGTDLGNITFVAAPSGLAAGSAVISHSFTNENNTTNTWSNDYSGTAYSSANSLGFYAHNAINVNAPFANAGTGKISLVAGWDGISPFSAPGVTTGAGKDIIIGGTGVPVAIASVGGDITLLAGNTVRVQAGSSTGGTNLFSGIDMGAGALSVTGQNIEIVAGAMGGGYADTNNSAFITTNGIQQFTVAGSGHLWLKGGGNAADANDYGNSARIEALGSGSQTISIGAGGSVEVLAGNGSGADYGGFGGGCPVSGSPACSNNQAEIRANGGGNQTIAFAGAGNLKVYGDLTGTAGRGNNSAEIGVANGGSQTISGNAAIEIKAAGVGGFFDGTKDFGNGAGIFSEGTQTISGTTLTLDASGVAGIGGAYLVAPQQTLSFTGNVALTGGTSSLASERGVAAAALIGYDKPANVSLTTTGNLTLNSGSGSAGMAAIGSLLGSTAVNLTAASMNVNGTANAAAAIGTLSTAANASVTLTATGTGGINLGTFSKLAAGNGSVSFVANNAGGASLTQSGSSQIVAQTISAIGNRSIALTGLNNNALYFSGSSSLSTLAYTSNSPMVHITSAQGATGVTLTTTSEGTLALAQANPRNIGLGSIGTATGNISVTAQNAILDDNGEGTANISAPSSNISLVSTYGTVVSGALAISTDIATAGQVNASVTGGPYGSIVIRDVGANQSSLALLNASAATAEGHLGYYRYGNLSLANISLSQRGTDSVAIGASGNIAVPTGYLFGAGAADATLFAGGNLLVNGGNLAMRADSNAIFAGGLINVSAGRTIGTDPGKPLTVAAGGILLNGGALKADADLTVITPSNIDLLAGGLLESTNGKLIFLADNLNVTSGTINGKLGIDGTLFGGLTLGASAGGTGTMNAASGIVDLAIGGAGIEMYNGSWINSSDATQPAGGLIKLFFSSLSSGGSMIDGVVTFDGGYKVGGSFNTLGTGLDVTYGQFNNAVTSSIVDSTTKATDATDTGLSDGTNSTTTLLAGAGDDKTAVLSSGTGTTDSNSFGGSESTASGTAGESSPSGDKGGKDDAKNTKKKPAQCSA